MHGQPPRVPAICGPCSLVYLSPVYRNVHLSPDRDVYRSPSPSRNAPVYLGLTGWPGGAWGGLIYRSPNAPECY